MKKSKNSEEKIIGAVKQQDARQKVTDLAREHGISEATIYTWKSKYGGMDVSEAQRLKVLDDENRRLKTLVAALSLDKEVLKAVIRKNGWSSPMRLFRLYQDAGLAVRRLKRKRLMRPAAVQPLHVRANQEWALDFVADTLGTGRGIRVLTIVDAFTRECLGLDVDTSLTSRRVTRKLDQIIEQRGMPESIRCDNGPELTSRHILGWCADNKINLIHIQPGRPMQNGHVESFNGRFRDECLNATWFHNLADARAKIANWRSEYNGERPHSSLGRPMNLPKR